VRLSAEAKSLLLQFTAEPEVVLAPGDPNRLRQVIWNLLSNAIKFTSQGGWVNVDLRRVNSHVEISVIDSGVGIKADFLPYVFDRFRQADGSTKRKFGGLGLGLAIVQHIVELHGGSVLAHSDGEGRGATFTVRLPVADDEPSREWLHVRPVLNEAAALSSSIRLDGLRILLVDDEPDAREMLTALLKGYGAEIMSASSSAEALQLIEREDVDIIVSDIGMPHEDGYQFIRQVREQKGNRNSLKPALALTGYTRTADRVRVLAAGFHSHIAKPVEPKELAIVLASLTGRIKFGA